jgi:hypothetical protein
VYFDRSDDGFLFHHLLVAGGDNQGHAYSRHRR